MIKKIIALLMAGLIVAMVFTACDNNKANSINNEKIKIVTTIFPQYDWVKQIVGENSDEVELTLLLNNGVDLHSYQPTADDIIKISTCDMFIFTGGESDKWANDVLAQAKNDKMVVINLLDALGELAKEEELVEGMQQDEHEHDEAESELDEHVWLSLRNAKSLCSFISNELSKLNPAKASSYKSGAQSYLEKLNALDEEYKAVVKQASRDTLLFCDRFPFRYLVDDYSLNYYAAFAGCSAETQASFETVVFLANKIDELNLKNVMVIESSDQALAKTVIESTNAKNQGILVLNSLQSVTLKEIENGATYLSIMQENLNVLKLAVK